MKSNRSRGPRGRTWLAVLAMAAVLVFGAVPAMAQDADQLAKDANNELRSGERAMFSSKFDEALASLNKAKELIDQIKSLDPGHSKLSTLESGYERLERDLSRRMPKDEPKQPEEAAPAQAADPAQEKLPSNVIHYMEEVERTLASLERHMAEQLDSNLGDDWKLGQLDSLLQSVDAGVENILSRYGDKFSQEHPNWVAFLARIEKARADAEVFRTAITKGAAAAEADETARQAQSQEWVAKLRPYLDSNSEKVVWGSYTEEDEEMARRRQAAEEAGQVYAEYLATEFPNGKTEELESMAGDLGKRLEDFKAAAGNLENKLYEQARAGLQEAFEFLDEADAWTSNPAALPNILDKDRMEWVRKQIDDFAAEAGKDAELVAQLRGLLADLEAKDAEHRAARMERTFLLPEKYAGEQADEVRDKAAELVREEHPGAKVLRTVIISEDWKEEEAVEYTDTTQTQVRHRITRSLTAQAAANVDGGTVLCTVYVAKDRRTDGTWSPLYGNVMYEDPMLEENVNRAGP